MIGSLLVEKLFADGRIDDTQMSSWREMSGLLSALEAIGKEGASVVIKVDGARTNNSIYTVVVSGGRLGEEFFRRDANDLASLLHDAVDFYQRRVWM